MLEYGIIDLSGGIDINKNILTRKNVIVGLLVFYQ